jgi:rare lipoprotein A (peptidoglycan hydrolase)
VCESSSSPALRAADIEIHAGLRKVRSGRERLAAVLAAASKKLRERFGACARNFGPWLIIAIGFAVATAMFGCSEQRAPQNQYALPAPSRSYSYVPPRSRLEVASWYGPGFVGHIMSDGEMFNPNELTAASKTLPIGSHVRVTNPDNGRSVVVRINDRGPYVRGRSLDLSPGAAQQIGLTAKGVCRVRVSAVGVTPHDAPYIRRTTYDERGRRSSRRRRVSNPPDSSPESNMADRR